MFDVKVELSSLLENGSGNISHQKGMEMDLNLATIGWKMVEVLSKLKKKQRRSVRSKFLSGR